MRVPLTTLDFLDRAELVFGGRTGIVDEPGVPGSLGRLSWRDVAARCRALNAGLDELGIGRGERIAVVSPNSARLLELLYGGTAGGRIVVPINFRLNPVEVTYIVEHSGASVLLVDPEFDEALAGVHAKNRFVLGAESDAALLRPDREPVPWEAPDEDATATINYTSGTTARPKGVQLSHRQIWTNAVTFGWHTRVHQDDVYLHTLPQFHVNGWGMPWAMAAMGVRNVIQRQIRGPQILERVRDEGVTLMCCAPAVVNTVLDTVASGAWDGEVPGRGRVRAVVAGAPPPTKTIQRVEEELGWEFGQLYGLTETSPLVTINLRRGEYDELSPEDRARKLSRAGAPSIGTRVRISDSGEVLVRSNHVLEGYWSQPDATAAALEDGWFHTGDGGALDDEGFLTITDRKKDVIITGGENVSSIEVEDRIFSHPAVAEVAVIGIPDEKWGELVTALVVLAPGETATEQEIIDWARGGLAAYKSPKKVEFREAIPRTATGKVQKFKLRDDFWAGRDRQVH